TGTQSTTYSGVMQNGSGTLAFTKIGTGTLTLSGANTYTGATSLGAGLLNLNFSTVAANIISGSSTLNFNGASGGTLTLTGNASTANSQTFNRVNVSSGANTITVTPGAGGTLTLNLGTITRTGGLLNFTAGSNGSTITITTLNAAGDLGAWATIGGTSFATVTSGGTITAATSTDLTWGGSISAGATAVSMSGGPGTSTLNFSGTGSISTLLQNSASAGTLNFEGTKTLQTPGLMIGAGKAQMTIGASANDGTLMVNSSGGPLSLINNNSGTLMTVNSVIANNGTASSLLASGGGTIILAGNNVYTGTTTVDIGSILQVGAGGTTGALGTGTVTDNGVLAFNLNNTATFANTLSGTGALNQIGTGTTVLTGNNTYSGGTTISGGMLTIGGSGGLASAGTISIGSGATFNYASSAAQTLSGTISGSGVLLKSSTGTLTLSAANTFTGNTTISAGTVIAGNANAFGTSGVITLGDANSGADAISLSYGANTISRPITVANYGGTVTFGYGNFTAAITLNRNVVLGWPSQNSAFKGGISGTGSLTISGLTTTFIDAANTFSGDIQINSGAELDLNNGGGQNLSYIPDTSSVNVIGTLYNVNQGYNETINALTGSGTVKGYNNTITFGGGNGSGLFSGTMTSGSGNLGIVKIGSGTQTLTGNSSYTLGTTISGGTLVMGASQSLGTISASGATGSLTLNSGTATLVVGATGTIGALSGTGGTITATGNFVLTSSGTVTQNTTFSGVMQDGTGTLAFTKIGTGTLTLSGVNTYTGGTTLSGGALSIGTDANIGGASRAITFSGGTLQVTGTTLVNLDSHAVNWGTFNGGFDINNSANTFTVSQTIGGSGSLTKAGAGTLTLSGNNTYTGVTTIGAGTLIVTGNLGTGAFGNLGSVSTGAGTLTLGGGVLQYTGTAQNTTINRPWQMTASSSIDVTTGNTLTISTAAPSTTSALTKVGAGTLILSGANAYSGGTTLTGGILNIANNDTNLGTANSSTSGTLTFNGGTLQFGSSSAITIAMRPVVLNAGILGYVDTSLSSGTISSIISGTGSLTKVGAGTLVLAGSSPNTYSGVTTVSGGSLLVNGNNTGTGAFTVNSTAILGGNGTIAGSVTVNGGAALTPGNSSGSGTLTVGGSLTLANNSTLNFAFSNSGTVSSFINAGALTLNNGGTISVDLTYNNGTVTEGTYKLIKRTSLNGSGTLSLTSINGSTPSPAYVYEFQPSGDGWEQLVISPSTANSTWIGTGGTSWSTASSWVGSTAPTAGLTILVFGDPAAVTTTANNDFSAAGSSTFAGLTFQNSSYTLTGNSATLTGNVLNNTGSLQTISLTGLVLGTGNHNFNTGTGTIALGSPISSVGGLTVLGTGTLTLSGDNSYTGPTSVSIGLLNLTGTLSGTAITVSGGALTESAAGVIASGSALTVSGGTATLSGANTYTGGTTLSGGILNVSADSNLGTATSSSAGTLTFSGGTLLFGGAFTIANRPVVLSTVGNLDTSLNSGTIASIISGAGSLNKATTGILTLSGANTYTGGTTLSAGTLNLGNTTALGATASTLTISDGTTLDGSVTIANANPQSWNGNFTFSGASGSLNLGTGTVTPNASRTVTVTANTLTVGGVIGGGAIALTKAGNGTLTLAGVNTYTGGTTINAGTLSVATINTTGAGNLGSLSASVGTLTLGGGVLQYTGSSTTFSSPWNLVTATGSGIDVVANTLTITTAAPATSGSLTKSGAGTLILTGVNLYTG
ncbi:MAG: autotransporter-associated beta strand repeat-containing protein, partial [bacterium]